MSGAYKIVEKFHPEEKPTQIFPSLTYQGNQINIVVTKFEIAYKKSEIFPLVSIHILVPSSFSMGQARMIVHLLKFESDNLIFHLFNLDLKAISESFIILDDHMTFYASNFIPFVICDNYYSSYDQLDKSITFLTLKKRGKDPRLGTIKSNPEGYEIFSIKEDVNLNPRWHDLQLSLVQLTQSIQHGLISVMQIDELKNNPKVKLSREKRVLLAASLLKEKNE